MLAAALPFIGGFGVGGCAYALRLQNDCFVWLRAPFPPRALAVAALAFRRLALRSVRGAAAVGVRTAAIALFLQTFHFIFLPAPLDTRLSLCYNHRRSDGGSCLTALLYHKKTGLVKPRLFVFPPSRAWQDPPTTLFLAW